MKTGTASIVAARQAHSARCRQRVINALNESSASGQDVTISAIARRAGVNRSLLYRHPDLHALVQARAVQPLPAPAAGPAVSPASLVADLAGAHDRIKRLHRVNTQLRNRLSEALGDNAWRESGLGAPDDVSNLQQRITDLEQQVAELKRQLSERDEDLDAARATSRQLMTALNRQTRTHHQDE